MSFLHDNQVRYLYYFIVIILLIMLIAGVVIQINQTEAVKDILLEHDKAIISSLLENDISEDIIKKAIVSTSSSNEAVELLNSYSMTNNYSNIAFPYIIKHQKSYIVLNLCAIFFFAALALVGITIFITKREGLYQKADSIIRNYIDGNYINHLSQPNEGSIYKMFSSIEQLATILQAKSEAEHKTKEFLKGTISDISHQLKTPLAALSMYQEIIANEPDNVDTVISFIQKIGLSLKRMEQLIQAMLKITRLDTGNILFDKKSYRVSELIYQSISDLSIRAENENKTIKLDIAAEDMILCDIEWTREAIGNIVKNALDHTSSGDTVCISSTRSPAMIRISIADNGNGIAPEDIHHIFKRFYRSNKSMDTQGVGLGLSLAKSIVEGQGGVISVNSEVNKGTTFVISFLA